jgi:hypothetical protein
MEVCDEFIRLGIVSSGRQLGHDKAWGSLKGEVLLTKWATVNFAGLTLIR